MAARAPDALYAPAGRARGTRRALRRLRADPLEVLSALRGRPGLVGLVGAWVGGGALVACDPVAVLGPDEDPFEVLALDGPPEGDEHGSAWVGGGWFGLWGYQLARRLERLPAPPPRPLPQTDHWLGRYEWVLRHDAQGLWWLESLLPEAEAAEDAAKVLAGLEEALAAAPTAPGGYRLGASVEELAAAHAAGGFTHLIIAPGPGYPVDAGTSVTLIRRLADRVPVLGVCLGHQAIAEAYGGRVLRAPKPVHGKPALIHHDGRGVFTGIDGPCVAARYHTLAVDQLPAELEVSACTADGTIMGIRHRRHRVEGVQIHPESILTPAGHKMIASFLARTPTTPR